MLSEEQKRQINLKILKVTSVFLETGASIEEVSERTGITKSSVQRYLNDSDRIIELLGEEVNIEIQKMLKINKHFAVQSGGLKYAKNNISLKDEKGCFIGSMKK